MIIRRTTWKALLAQHWDLIVAADFSLSKPGHDGACSGSEFIPVFHGIVDSQDGDRWVARLPVIDFSDTTRSNRVTGTHSLKGKLQRQLNRARVIGGCDGAEVIRTVISAYAAVERVTHPLRVVPKVEELRTELEIGAAVLIKEEVLEQRYVPIVAPRAAHAVMRLVAPSSRGWRGKDRGIEPFLNGMRIHHSPIHVGTIGSIGNDTRHVLPGQSDVQRSAS